MSTTIDGSAGVTTNSGAVYNGIASGTAVASTSGTSIDFTGIPSWVKRITVMFNGVSTNGTSAILAQVGAGSVTTSGYNSGNELANAAGVNLVTSTAGFVAAQISVNTDSFAGSFTITNITSNTWVASGVMYRISATGVEMLAGNIALGGTLDRVRITTVNGTDTFDAGSINILYE